MTTPTPASTRAHLYRAITDETGALATYATVTVYLDDGVTLYPGTIFRTESDPDTWPNPFIAAPSLVDVYLDQATRVRLGVVTATSSTTSYTEAIDVVADPAMMVRSNTPVRVDDAMPPGGMFSVTDSLTPYWRQIYIDHEHTVDGDQTLFLGDEAGMGPQDATFSRTAVLGGGGGTDIPPTGLDDTVALGGRAAASGARTTAVGAYAVASEHPGPPWTPDSLAAGHQSWAREQGVALGHLAQASDGGQGVALGREAYAGADAVVALGPFAHGERDVVSIGYLAGEQSWGMPGSVGLGADAQFGLPSTTDSGHFAVLLGAHDPSANVVFPWANPRGSQSESPLDEYTPTMAFDAPTVQLQRHLNTVLAGLLSVAGDATFGRDTSSLAFYGAAPQRQRALGDDEPASGIEALDSLVYALRDLGLLGSRHEVSTLYSAADMLAYYRDGDDAMRWVEHAGVDRAVAGSGHPPTFSEADRHFNGRPVMEFSNGRHGVRAQPREVMLGQNLITRARHVIAVADHTGHQLGTHEGLVNLAGGGGNGDVMLQAWGNGTHYFDAAPLGPGTTYTRNECDQSWNFDAQPREHAQVYRVSKPTGWPTGSLVLGGPAEAPNPALADYWSGGISTVALLDASWPEPAVRSMTEGLMFRYHVEQDDDRLRNPAVDFIVKQHDPLSGVKIRLDCDYEDSFVGTVSGEVYGVHTRLVDVPWVNIWPWFECYEYCGPLVGAWANLPEERDPHVWDRCGLLHEWLQFFNPWRRYHVMVTVQRKNHIVDIADSEWMFSFCWCEDAGIWTTCCDWVPRGYKTAYIVDRFTNQVIATSGNPSQKHDDIEVRGYIRNGDGSLTQVDSSPLWCDNAFRLIFGQAGHKVVRVYQLSTGTVLASTEWQERSLPRSTVASQDDPDYTQGLESEARTYDAAVAVMALCEAGEDYFPRARTILATMVSLQNGDGSINDSYDSLFPAKTVGTYSARSIVWFGIALMYYQTITGDGQFFPAVDRVARWMFNHQHDGLMPASGTDSSYRTDDNVSAYFFFQRFAEVIAENGS